jgi:hypothetical protein
MRNTRLRLFKAFSFLLPTILAIPDADAANIRMALQ